MDKKRLTAGVACVILAAMVLGIVMQTMGKAVREGTPYSRTEVEYVREEGKITQIEVRGKIPWGNLTAEEERETRQDDRGKNSEVIERYRIKSGFSLRRGMSLKISPEISEDIHHTYILEFADREIIVRDGLWAGEEAE